MSTAVRNRPAFDGNELGAVTLKNGQTFKIRLGTPADRPALIVSFERLSPESRYFRFFSPMPKLSKSMADYLCDVDATDRVAVVAYHPDRPDELVGVVRYYRDEANPAEAEVSLTVLDDYQGLGLGSAMYDKCVDVAKRNGINTFTAETLADNVAMIGFFASRGADLARTPGDATTVLARLSLTG